ncbi:MAG: sigma-70 family RNA polymerase sigma factor [Polyangiaceae bacterium]|nr:sigma-70 family RNA polymerase sigma factor [Polyangiaceae bacterium]
MTQPEKTSEIEPRLAAQAIAGDLQAQERFLLHYYSFIRATLIQLTFGRIDDLEELQQQAMIRVTRGLAHFAQESQPSTWVRGVCANVVKDHLRRKTRRQRAEMAHQRLTEEANFLEPGATLEARDMLNIVRSILDTLSPEQCTAFVLRVLYGHAVEEVARMMGASKAATRARLYFARRKVLSQLKQELGDRDSDVVSQVMREVNADEL